MNLRKVLLKHPFGVCAVSTLLFIAWPLDAQAACSLIPTAGNDSFTWKNGGQIKSAILMGDGDDSALLSNLNENILSSSPSLDGGLGNDRLTLRLLARLVMSAGSQSS